LFLTVAEEMMLELKFTVQSEKFHFCVICQSLYIHKASTARHNKKDKTFNAKLFDNLRLYYIWHNTQDDWNGDWLWWHTVFPSDLQLQTRTQVKLILDWRRIPSKNVGTNTSTRSSTKPKKIPRSSRNMFGN